MASRKCLFTLRHEPTLLTASFNTTGTTVVTTKLPHELKQWCVRSGACISTLRLSAHGRIDFAFSAQGVNVLHTGEEGCATLWNMETGTRLWEHGIDVPSFRFQGACLSRCGTWFGTMTPDVPVIRDWVARCQARPAVARTRESDARLTGRQAA